MSSSVQEQVEAAADPTTSKSGNIFISIGSSLAVLALVAILTKKLTQQRDFDWKIHLGYWVVALLVIVLLPFSISKYVFSELTLSLIGALFPVYESVLAVCTPDEQDDTDWLRYWTIGGIFFVATEWVDNAMDSDVADVYWYKFASFLLFWLYYPRTSGAVLIDEHVTQKYLAPKMRPLHAKMTKGIDNLVKTFVNAVHLYIIFFFFMFLPAGLKRICAIAVGTVYPFVSSVSAITTEEFEDDAYWLTYWACYGILFMFMDVTETWLGWIPGFYTFVILAEVYLMLPMFGGADKLFRKVLVPLFGLQEILMVRDAFLVKKQLVKDLSPERAAVVRKAIANFFTEDEQHKNQESDLMTAFGFLKKSNNNSKNGNKNNKGEEEPTETSNLV